jgi:hypothetical protein
MKTKLTVEKEKFDTVLSMFLKSKPTPRKAITGGGAQPLTFWVPQPFAPFAKGAGFEVTSRPLPEVLL